MVNERRGLSRSQSTALFLLQLFLEHGALFKCSRGLPHFPLEFLFVRQDKEVCHCRHGNHSCYCLCLLELDLLMELTATGVVIAIHLAGF